MELARRFQLRIVEDAAQGLGVRYRDRHVGTFGDAGILSFNGNKIVTAGGGGMVLTHDPACAARARYLSTQARDDEREYLHGDIGYNYRLTNLQAAVGLAQLEQLEAFLRRKREIASAYAAGLGDLADLELMPTSPDTRPSFWLYTVRLASGTTRARREAVIARLDEQGVEARALWRPLHEQAPYRACEAPWIEAAPRLCERSLSLPSSPTLREEELAYCIEAVRDAVRLEGP